MSESNGGAWLGLDPDTQQRMQEVFAGHVCCRCERPAERLCAEDFYCTLHFTRGKPAQARPPKVYRMSSRMRG